MMNFQFRTPNNRRVLGLMASFLIPFAIAFTIVSNIEASRGRQYVQQGKDAGFSEEVTTTHEWDILYYAVPRAILIALPVGLTGVVVWQSLSGRRKKP
jgi:hypothetical protein